MKVKVEISRLVESADDTYKKDLVPLESPAENCEFSADRIKELALQKLQAQTLQEEMKGEPKMRRLPMKIVVVAAVLCTLTVSAFAAANGGLEYFRAIFGGSIEHSAEHIQNVMQAAEAGDYRLTIESVLTDGNTANVIVSLENTKGKKLTVAEDLVDMFRVNLIPSADSDGLGVYSSGWTELYGFDTKSKHYFDLEVSGVSAVGANEISQLEISLSEDYAPISMQLDLVNYMAHLEVLQDEADFAEVNLTVMSLQISPMGALMHGRERTQQGSLEAPMVFLMMKDGSAEEVFSAMSFDSNDDGETVMGGGGMVVAGDHQQAPLVTSTQGMRNEDNSIVMRAGFSRILDLSQVAAVRINGIDYPVELR